MLPKIQSKSLPIIPGGPTPQQTYLLQEQILWLQELVSFENFIMHFLCGQKHRIIRDLSFGQSHTFYGRRLTFFTTVKSGQQKMQKVGFEPTPFRNRALIYRLRPLGHFYLSTNSNPPKPSYPIKSFIIYNTQVSSYQNGYFQIKQSKFPKFANLTVIPQEMAVNHLSDSNSSQLIVSQMKVIKLEIEVIKKSGVKVVKQAVSLGRGSIKKIKDFIRFVKKISNLNEDYQMFVDGFSLADNDTVRMLQPERLYTLKIRRDSDVSESQYSVESSQPFQNTRRIGTNVLAKNTQSMPRCSMSKSEQLRQKKAEKNGEDKENRHSQQEFDCGWLEKMFRKHNPIVQQLENQEQVEEQEEEESLMSDDDSQSSDSEISPKAKNQVSCYQISQIPIVKEQKTIIIPKSSQKITLVVDDTMGKQQRSNQEQKLWRQFIHFKIIQFHNGYTLFKGQWMAAEVTFMLVSGQKKFMHMVEVDNLLGRKLQRSMFIEAKRSQYNLNYMIFQPVLTKKQLQYELRKTSNQEQQLALLVCQQINLFFDRFSQHQLITALNYEPDSSIPLQKLQSFNQLIKMELDELVHLLRVDPNYKSRNYELDFQNRRIKMKQVSSSNFDNQLNGLQAQGKYQNQLEEVRSEGSNNK